MASTRIFEEHFHREILAVWQERRCRHHQARPRTEAYYHEHGEGRADIWIGDDPLHARYVVSARNHFEARMRVPFAKVIETSVLPSGFFKEDLELPTVFFCIPDEVRPGPSVSLHADICNTKVASAEMLA